MNKTSIIIGFVGIGLIIFGWFLSNSERFPFIFSIFAPKYLKVNAALEQLTRESSIQNGDKGFSELADLVMNKFIKMSEEERKKSQRLGIKITKIEMLKNLITLKERSAEIKTGITLKLKTTLSNGQTTEGNAFDLSSLIKEKYLNSPLFKWGSFIFWIGIILSIIIIIISNFLIKPISTK